MNLIELGWGPHQARSFEAYADNYSAGRVMLAYQTQYQIATPQGELIAELAGKLRYEATTRSELPAVGDWVVIRQIETDRAIIHAVLPRRSQFARKAPGSRTERQVIAANIDTLFLVCGLDGDFNLRRIERYLVMALESGASPVILLNKADLCDDLKSKRLAVSTLLPQNGYHPDGRDRTFATPITIISLSALYQDNLNALSPFLKPGKTVALLGSSGVGKSTLTNQLMGRSVQATHAVRADDSRGRHTTSHRELLILPSGALLIDTPGLREIQLWSMDESVNHTFEDIEQLAASCRFRDCQHQQEPGCAVKAAIDSGQLAAKRLLSYQKLQREQAYVQRQQDKQAQANAKARWKSVSKSLRKHHKKR